MINKVIMIGTLGRDADFHVSPGDENKNRANFSIALNKSKKVGGEWHTETLWMNCVFFGKYAGEFSTKAMKGCTVYVEGSLSVENKENKSGEEKTYVSILCNQAKIVGKPTKQSYQESLIPPVEAKLTNEGIKADFNFNIDDDNIPF